MGCQRVSEGAGGVREKTKQDRGKSGVPFPDTRLLPRARSDTG